ncbi:hypothetical protein NXC24_CH02366 [Rhizobium sp. NXC24]|nr:hypothetical protein NXC24_CH02366 [Rhizobium sp. NXC24]
MSLPLFERNAETTDFSFECGDVADSTNGDPPEFISATASFSQLTRVAVRRALLTALFGSLETSGMRVPETAHDAGGD